MTCGSYAADRMTQPHRKGARRYRTQMHSKPFFDDCIQFSGR